MKASSESGLWAMRMMVVAGSVMAPEAIRIEDTPLPGKAFETRPLGRTAFRSPPSALRTTPLFSIEITGGTPLVYIECQKRGMADGPRPIQHSGDTTMTTKNRNLAKGMLPALLLSAALSVPVTALAAPASQGKAHATDKAKSHQEKAQQHAQQAQRQAQKAQQQARKAQQAQRGPNKKQTAVVVAPQRRVVVAPQRVVVPQRRVVVVPAQPVVVAQRNRNRAQYDGWNRRYNKYSTGLFELEATSVGRQQGCALVRDSQGQVIPLVGIDPLALRTGEHILFSGRIQNNTACGTAFRVNRVERVWTDASHRRLLFDSRRDGDYVDYYSRERYNDRDRYDDRYARDRDRYDDDRYDRYDDRSDNRVLTVDGRIDDRGRCTAIRGDRGEYYDLLGDLRGLGNGDHVRVIGYPGVRSSCGGQAIEIQEIRRR